MAVDADGLHVGQSDMPVDEARKWLGPDKFIGLSVTQADEVLRADAVSADYLGVGPIFAQQTKADASAPLGLAGFQHIRALTKKPLVAIGGLNPDNSADIVAAGADGLAIVSAIVAADDPQAATRRFARLFT
jgi:thiamine-phosphate pyrophosphorylase